MKSLYDQYPDEWKKVEADGKFNLAEMARHFTDTQSMNDALGYLDAVKNWIGGRNRASGQSDRKAAEWLKNRVDITPVAIPDQRAGALLLVACPPGSDAKVAKVLAFLGCEVTEC